MTAEKLKIYFDITSSENNRIEGLCKLCKRVYKDLYGIYSNFKKHLKRQHPLEYRKAFCLQQEDDRSDEDISLEEDMNSIDSNDNNNKSNRINVSIAKNLIIKCNLPLSLVENPAFRDFMKECTPRWQPMSTKKLKNAIISSFKEKVHTTIFQSLQNVTDVSLTIDGWSDRRNRSFLGITCHFIDDQMIPKAYLIDFVRLKSPHTSENIQRQTEYVLDSYNIKEKVFRIITDNASNMVKAYKFGLSSTEEENDNSMDVVNVALSDNQTQAQIQEDLDDLDPNGFHFITLHQHENNPDSEILPSIRISCFAHTLQLVIRDGLQKVSQVSKVLGKCQILARCAQKSTKIADILERLQKRIERTTLTRWNSEFLLIKSILSINREDLESITTVMDNPVRFSNIDYVIMKEIVDILEPFYEISIKCQGEKLATISLVVPSIAHLMSHLQNFKENDTTCYKFVQQLQTSIEKRFMGIFHRLKLIDVHESDPFHDPLYFMATVLDPAFKFYWIHELNVDITVQAQLKHNIVQMIINEISKDSIISSKNMISLSTTEIRSSSVITSSVTLSNSERKRKKLFFYDEYRYNNRSVNASKLSEPSRELEIYLNDPVESKFSEYWRQSQLTNLKKLAVRLFSVQASSAPVERVFSHAGLICASRRTRLNQELFKDLVFLKVNQSLL